MRHVRVIRVLTPAHDGIRRMHWAYGDCAASRENVRVRAFMQVCASTGWSCVHASVCIMCFCVYDRVSECECVCVSAKVGGWVIVCVRDCVCV